MGDRWIEKHILSYFDLLTKTSDTSPFQATVLVGEVHPQFKEVDFMLQDPIQTLSRCLEHALSKGMGYVPRDAKTTREHHPDEVEVAGMFPQMWGSTALGFGGVGGSAMTVNGGEKSGHVAAQKSATLGYGRAGSTRGRPVSSAHQGAGG